MICNPLIFTDLDGSLLDHFTYSAEPALPLIQQLKVRNIPIIATTSKTIDEVVKIDQQLGLASPFIVENGAAVLIPIGYFPQQPADTQIFDNYWLKKLSTSQDHFVAIARQLAQTFPQCFTQFSDMSPIELADITQLTVEQAKLALARKFGEPILWLGDKNQQQRFIEHAERLGAHVLIGGRFLHLSDDCDKGQALSWLSNEYQQQKQLRSLTTIALGDSGNDSAMLEAADIAVQIKSPVHSFPTLATKDHQFIYQTLAFGPLGWCEALQFILNIPASELAPNTNQIKFNEFSDSPAQTGALNNG